MRPTVILVLAALVLSGCASSMKDQSKKECVGLGLKPGTSDYAGCWEQAMARRQSAINAATEAKRK